VLALASAFTAPPLRLIRRATCSRVCGVFAFDEACDAEVGWCTTASGLRYVDDEIGTGPLPSDDTVLRLSYTGTLLSDGRSVSFPDGKSPILFVWRDRDRLEEVVQEGIDGMRPEGSRRRVMVPPSAKLKAESSENSGTIDADDSLRFEFRLEVAQGADEAKARLSSSFGAVKQSLPAGVQAWLTPVRLLILLSLLPYVLPNDARPGPWRSGEQSQVYTAIERLERPQSEMDEIERDLYGRGAGRQEEQLGRDLFGN